MKSNIINNITSCNGLGEYMIVFNGGSDMEKKGTYGLSHLVEHCMCEDVKGIEQKLQELGLNWNAFTTKNEVAFFISGLTENVRKMMNEFTKIILNYKIEKEVFEREKKIILTEYNMYTSEQESQMFMNFLRKKYDICDPGGYKEDVENITYETFMEFKNKTYSEPSYIVFSHPKNEKDITLKDLNESLKGVKFNLTTRWNRKYKYGTYNKLKLESGAKFDDQRILYTYKEFSSDSSDDYLGYTFAVILKNILSSGLTSVLYQEIREKLGYVYNISVNIQHLEANKFAFLIETKAKADKIDVVTKKMKEVIGDIVSYISRKKYISMIDSLKSTIKTKQYLEFSYKIDDTVRQCEKNIIENSDSLKDNMQDFISTVLKLNLKNADYFIDTDFKE